MKEPMTAREFALILWGPIIVIALLVGAWMTVAEYNRVSEAGAEAARHVQQEAAELRQEAAQDHAAP